MTYDMISNLSSHIHLTPERWYDWLHEFLCENKDWNTEYHLSFEQRPIYTLRTGEGEQKIVIWSQMHGHESTGTYAISDLLTYFNKERDVFEALKKQYTIVLVPMLNPDGAARFIRYNALGSDLNREGLKTISPETELLKKTLSGQVALAFNLHDQRNIFSVGRSAVPAALSLLAPSTITSEGFEARKYSIRLISTTLEKFSSNERKYMARFSDEYYPRAMGEWCTDRGIPTILVEAGGYFNDPHRTFARSLTTKFLLYCLEAFVTKNIGHQSLYQTLPVNAQELRDLIIRNIRMQTPTGEIIFDSSFTAQYLPDQNQWSWLVDEVGDLDLKYGYKEIDLKSNESIAYLKFSPGDLLDFDKIPKSWHQWFTTI